MPHVELPSAEFKVVLLGDTNTGKTCLVLRLVEGSYKPSARSSTVGAFFLTKRLTVNNITCKMLLWDTAGQEQFQKLAVTYYQHAAAAIVCYDSSNPNSVVRLKRSLEELDRYIRQNHPMVLAVAACKSDLLAVPGLEEEARRTAKAYDALYFGHTSAKMNQGVTEVFQKTAARVLEWHELAVTGQARPLPVTVGSQRGPSTSTSSRYRSPSARTSAAHEYDTVAMTPNTMTTTTPVAATVNLTSAAATSTPTSTTNHAIPLVKGPLVGVGSAGSNNGGSGLANADTTTTTTTNNSQVASFSAALGSSQNGIGSSSSANQDYHHQHPLVSKQPPPPPPPPDQDSSTTANESDDATAEHEQHHQQHPHPHNNMMHANVMNNSSTSADGPRLNCDGSYLVCGVDGNDKNCVIS